MNNDSLAPTERSGWLIAWLVISQLIGLLSLIPWLIAVAMTYIATNGDIMQLMLLMYPIIPIGSAIAAWIFFARKKDNIALIITSLPLLFAVPVGLLLLS